MRILKKIKRKIVCGQDLRPATNNLPPILFHSIHGENVRVSSNGTTASRVNSYCKAVVFSNRPIKEKEKVYIKFSEISNNWSGALRFGFTSVNPSSFRSSSNLPKYVCPDMTDKPGSWAKALSERFATPDSILCFYFTSDGNIHYAVNGEDKGYFSLGLEGNNLWALIDIYGNTTGIELIDPRLHLKSHHNNYNNHIRSQCLAKRSQSMAVLGVRSNATTLLSSSSSDDEDEYPSLYEAMSGLSLVTHDRRREPLPQVYSKVNLQPLSFHRMRGCNIRLSNDRSVAERNDSHYSQGYTFSQRPLQSNEKIVLQVLQTDELYSGSLTFGLTTCNPSSLIPDDLPEDSHQLLDRPEYWVVVKDVANGPQAGDEIAFEITESGKVQMTKNRQAAVTLMHVDASQTFFPFFDLYGSTLKVRLLGTIKSSSPSRSCCSIPRTTCNSTENLYSTSLSTPLNVNVNLYNKSDKLIHTPHQHRPVTSTKGRNSSNQLKRHTINHHQSQKLSPPHSRGFPEYALPVKKSHPNRPQQHSPSYSAVSNASSGFSSRVSSGTRSNSLGSINNECTVCYEAPINTVLYMCGHMCMCYECAVKQWKTPGGGQCPICRAHIRDVIRTYWS